MKIENFIIELKESLEDDANGEEIYIYIYIYKYIYDAPDLVDEEYTYQAADRKTII